MNKRLIILIATIFLGDSLLIGGGTYALLTASTTNTSDQFGDFQAEAIDIQSVSASDTVSSPQLHTLFSNYCTQPVNLTMFYDHTFSGQNPYDVKTTYTPSGEIPGGWAPGDKVTRTWKISNSAAGSKITEIYAPRDKFTLRDRNGNVVSRDSQTYQDFLNHMNIEVYCPQDRFTFYTGTFQQLLQSPQPLIYSICLSKHSTTSIAFDASMDQTAGNDLQGVKGVLDFQLGAEQVKNNCFNPPFSNRDYSMGRCSSTPIKFECYDSDGNLLTHSQNVKLVINGRGLGSGWTYTLGNGLSLNGGHYQALVNSDSNLLQDGENYTATVYNGSQICGQKTFSMEPGNRSNK